MNKINFKLLGLTLLTLVPLNTYALKKDENIYATLDYSGNIKNTIVTSHLYYTGEEEYQDETLLKDIININGSETYTLNNNKLIWNTANKDIFYQGTVSKNLPITISAKYYLDGVEMNPEKIVGKSGKIKIVYKLTNKEKETVLINSKYQTVYTPFVTTLGLMLNNQDNSNVEISNGKIISTGKKYMIVGIASPGLSQSYNLDELNSLNEIVIEYTTKSFKLGNTYFASTPGLLSEVDLKIFNKMDSINENVNKLQESTDLICTSVKTLEDSINDQIDTYKKDGVLSSEQLSYIANSSWEQVKNSLENSNDDTIKNYATNSGTKILLTYFNNDMSRLQNAVQCATEYSLTNSANGTYCTNYIKYLMGDISNLDYQEILLLQNESINKLKQDLTFIATVNSELSDLSNKTVYYIGENVSKNVSTTVANQVSTSVAVETLTTVNGYVDELYNGLTKFNEEGINKLSSYAEIVNRYGQTTEALVKLSKNYKGYASGNSSNTTFIYLIK